MTEPLLINAALSGIGLITVATFAMVWRLRDDVRDLTRIVTDSRTGLTTVVDRLVTSFDNLDGRVDALESWREAQSEGEE